LPARLNGCRGVLVDSNVLLDVDTNDPNWACGPRRPIAEIADTRYLFINPIIYANIDPIQHDRNTESPPYPRAPLYQRDFRSPGRLVSWQENALCNTAGAEVYGLSPLPDFYIRRARSDRTLALLTRDPTLYRTYFPGLEILAPTKH